MLSISKRFVAALFALLLATNSLAFSASPEASAEDDPSAGAIHLGGSGEKWAAKTLKKMSVEEKVGQMIMVWARVQFMNVDSPDYAQLRDIIRKYHVGGFGLTAPTENGTSVKSQPFEAAQLTNRLQKDSELPLIFAADFERGLPMRINGATTFPAAMAFGAAGDKNLAFQFGQITAQEARAIGVHWNWFPTADVNSNPANPIINTRAFGEDPKQVSEFVTAYIAGARGAGMLTTLKHFPGHGDTDVDTHIGLARVNGSRERLDQLELVPFRAGIAAGVDSVMVAHVAVPAIEPDGRPASISDKVITGLLKHDLGFNGVVVTDALDMGALMRYFTGTPAAISGKEAVEAVKAGNDLVIIPADLDGAYHGLLDAVRRGEISESRIDESVLKILRLKASVGLNRKRTVELKELEKQIAKPESLATAQKIAEAALTLVRNNQKVLPLRSAGTSAAGIPYQQQRTGTHTVVLVLADDVRTTDGGRAFDRAFRTRVPDAQVVYLDEVTAAAMMPQVLPMVDQAERVIVATDVVPGAGRRVAGSAGGSVSLGPNSGSLLANVVQKAGEKTVVVALGNPYVITSVPEIQNYLCTFSNVPASAVGAVRALFGEIPTRGRMPVTIPGIAERGSGLELGTAR